MGSSLSPGKASRGARWPRPLSETLARTGATPDHRRKPSGSGPARRGSARSGAASEPRFVQHSERLLGPLLLSFEVSVLATALAGFFGIALAGLLSARRFPGSELLDALLNAPLVLPPTVLGYYLLVLLGRETELGRAYEAVTGSSIVFTRTGATCAATLAALPFVARSARAALDAVEARYAEAASTLGASPLRAFVRVLLPLASRGIFAGLTLGFARSLGDFGVTLMVAGNIPGRTQTAPLAIYDAIQAGREAQAGGLAAVLTTTAVVSLYAINKLTPRRVP
jgi:molybdate transport system permease protein